ncbi:DNA-binding response regulator, partial [Rhodococcus sp. NPDC127527]
ARGLTIPASAGLVYRAPTPATTHAPRLYETLGVGARAAAVAEAMRRGLLE